MENEKLCWCGRPVEKNEVESSAMAVVYRCSAGHRLMKESALKTGASLVSFATMASILFGVDVPDLFD